MKKPIIISFFIMFIGIIIGMIFVSWELTIKICGIAGLVCLGIGGLLNGSFVSGDRNRVNLSFETKEDRNERDKITNFVIVVGLPNIILAVILLFTVYN